MEDLKFVYEHYRVPRKFARPPAIRVSAEDVVDLYSLRYDDSYRQQHLIPSGLRCDGDGAYEYGYEPATHGGKTVCKVLRWDAEEDCWTLVARGVARCSLKDQFNYEIGRRIAKGRALKKMEEGAIER